MRAALPFFAALLLCIGGSAAAQPPDAEDATALAKKTQNPVSDLISLPFQFNFNTGGDLGDRTLFNLNFQPVIPFKLNTKWSAIARPIVPINSVPGDGTSYSGIGDIQTQLFVTPAKPGKVIWGVGPVFSFPTATAAPLRTGTWGGGLAAVGIIDVGPWVIGSLVTQTWPMSDAGGEPKVNAFLMQPFVNYNFGRGWALGFAPNITANWDAGDDDEWTVPLGLGITRTTVFNRRPMTLGIQYYRNVTRPRGSAASLLRIAVSLLYPRT